MKLPSLIYCSYKGDGYWWFRVFRHGLHGRDTTKITEPFSERFRYEKPLHIGKWAIKILKP